MEFESRLLSLWEAILVAVYSCGAWLGVDKRATMYYGQLTNRNASMDKSRRAKKKNMNRALVDSQTKPSSEFLGALPPALSAT